MCDCSRGGKGGTAIYGLYRHVGFAVKSMGFQAVYSRIGYSNQTFGSRIVYHFSRNGPVG